MTSNHFSLHPSFHAGPLSLICGVEVCLYSADRQEIQESILFQIMLMPHCKNLEIFTGSEGGDIATNNAWNSFQRYCYLENSQSGQDICHNFIFSVSSQLHLGTKD